MFSSRMILIENSGSWGWKSEKAQNAPPSLPFLSSSATGFPALHFYRTPNFGDFFVGERQPLQTKFSEVSLAIKLGMKIWLEFAVCRFVLVVKIKTKRKGASFPDFCCCSNWEKVRYYKTKSLHLSTKANIKRTANWNTDYVGAKFAARSVRKILGHIKWENEKCTLWTGGSKIDQSVRCQLPCCQLARCHFSILHLPSLSLACYVCFARARALLRSLNNHKCWLSEEKSEA